MRLISLQQIKQLYFYCKPNGGWFDTTHIDTICIVLPANGFTLGDSKYYWQTNEIVNGKLRFTLRYLNTDTKETGYVNGFAGHKTLRDLERTIAMIREL